MEECLTVFLVEARLKFVGGRRSAGRMEAVRNVLKVSELNNSVKERAYPKNELWRGGEVESAEKEYEKFRDIVMEYTNDICGMRCVGWQRGKGNEWWNDEMGGVVAEKRRAFEEWLWRRDRITYDRYRAQRVVVKPAVKVVNKSGGLAMEESDW